jgi:GTP cyclohydrolase I
MRGGGGARGGDAPGAGSTSAPASALVVDRDALESAVRELLRALGEDVTREGLADTPKRVAKAMAFAVRGYGTSAVAHVESALFHEPTLKRDEEAFDAHLEGGALPSAEASGGGVRAPEPGPLARSGVVLIRDIPFFSTHEDSLLPFYGRCHIGYVPSGGQIIGLSKVARVAEAFARRVQTPDRLAADVARAVAEGASPRGVCVVLEAAQMGPAGPFRIEGEASVGCFREEEDECKDKSAGHVRSDRAPAFGSSAREYRDEFRAMLRPGVGAGAGHVRVGLEGGDGGVCAPCEPSGGSPLELDSSSLGSGGGPLGSPVRSASPGSPIANSVECAEATGEAEGSAQTALPHHRPGSGFGPAPGVRLGGGGGGGEAASRPTTPNASTEGFGFGAAASLAGAAAPEEARGAAERVMRAMGLEAIMPAEKIRATAARYADLMAASRAGHAMAAEDEKVLFGEKKRKRAGGGAEGGGDAEGDSSRFPSRSERDLELATLCEHHLLPFHGAVHVSYAVSGTTRQLTRGELQRIVTTHGRRLQVQERLTRDVAADVVKATGSPGVMVAVRASHLCMIARGVEKPGSTTCTSACLGLHATDAGRRTAFWRELEAKGGR